jgi:hypothetical protein
MFTAVRSLLASPALSSLALVVAALATGCSAATDATPASNESSAQALTSADELCAAACSRIAGCGGSDDTASCTESCQAASGTALASLDTAASTIASGCVDHASCSDVVGANFVNDCIDVALEETGAAPTTAGTASGTGAYEPAGTAPDQPVANNPRHVD